MIESFIFQETLDKEFIYLKTDNKTTVGVVFPHSADMRSSMQDIPCEKDDKQAHHWEVYLKHRKELDK